MGSGLDRIANNLSRGNLFPEASNFMGRLFYTNCSTPFYVYVETFLPCFLELWFTLAFLDLEDLLRDRAKRLASGRGSPTGRGGSHVGKGRLPGFSPNKERYAQGGLKHLLRVTQPLENIGFAFLIYGATSDFFYDWTSLLEARNWCKDPTDAGPLSRRSQEGSMVPNENLGGVALPILEQNRSGWSSGSFSCAVPPGHYDAHFAVTIRGPAPGGVEYQAGLNVSGALIGGSARGGPVRTEKAQPADLVVSTNFFAPTLAGAAIHWGVAGPPVPVGLQVDKGFFGIYRRG